MKTYVPWLEQFETLVLSQHPASESWTPVTDYSFEARKAVEGQHPQLIKDTFAPNLVLDAGCGPHGHLVKLLQSIGVAAMGFDTQIPVSYLPEANDACVYGDLLRSPRSSHWYRRAPDLVICREVLEHLTILQIKEAVANLCALSTKFVYVTTRFAKTPQSLLDVDTADDLDPTHITMLNQDLLRLLFVLEGFKRRADLETKLDWQQKGRCLVYERAV
jgi:hypothetical protein